MGSNPAWRTNKYEASYGRPLFLPLSDGLLKLQNIDEQTLFQGAPCHRLLRLMDLSALLVVCPLVFLGGLVDAIAGGGGLIALPAYLIAGLPPHLAIGTNKLSSTLGMAVSTWKLAQSGFVDWKIAPAPVLAAFVGSIGGASLALALPADIFKIILLVLLPVVAGIVLRGKNTDTADRPMKRSRRMLILGACALACGAYDGFYGPGAGTFLLISFTVFAGLDVRNAAGQMKAANLACGSAALATFAAAGQVSWTLGLVAGLFGIAGHYIGASLVVKNGAKIVRPIIISVLCLLFVKTIWGYFAQ